MNETLPRYRWASPQMCTKDQAVHSLRRPADMEGMTDIILTHLEVRTGKAPTWLHILDILRAESWD